MLLDSYDAESEIIILSKNRDSHSIQLYLARFYASEEKPKNIFRPTSLQIKIKIHISCKVFFAISFYSLSYPWMKVLAKQFLSMCILPQKILHTKNFYQVLYKTISKLNLFFDDVAKRMPSWLLDWNANHLELLDNLLLANFCWVTLHLPEPVQYTKVLQRYSKEF